MKVTPCPKCRSIRTAAAPAGEGWMHCEKCSHTWMHGSEAELPPPVASPPVPPRAEAEPSAPSGRAEEDAALPPLPAPAGPEPEAASPTGAGQGSDVTPGADYLPETHALANERLALTDRHQQPQVLDTDEFTPTSSPTIDAQDSDLIPLEKSRANQVVNDPTPKPKPKPKPISPPARPGPSERGGGKGSTTLDDETQTRTSGGGAPRQAAPGGSQVAFDLFDAIEREIEHERDSLATQAQVGGNASALSCPVCSHRFNALLDHDSVICPKCGSDVSHTARYEKERAEGMDSRDPLLGATIRGCKIDRKIGEGGMGSVYHARQLSLDRSVAIKVLPPELKRDKKFLTRFEQEAKSLARINHPNIMHVYDFGEDDGVGIYFMVMEFVDGLDLAEILRQKRRLPALEVLDMMRQSALGLSQACDKGVVHRDIKPDNLMVTADGVWKVSDFGLAKHVDALTQVTRAGIRVGTPAFMSPEQCDGKPLDFRSDIYSLGVTGYVSLSGRLPFDGESPFAIMLKHKTQHPADLVKHVSDISPGVSQLVMRMLSKDPPERAESWEALIDQFDQVIEEIGGGQVRGRSGLYPARTPSQHESSHSHHAAEARADEMEDDRHLPPIPVDLLGGESRLSPAEVVEREGAVTTSRRRAQAPSSRPAGGSPQVAQPAGRILPDSSSVGEVFDALGGESQAPSPAALRPATPPLDLAPMPEPPAVPTAAEEPQRSGRGSEVQAGARTPSGVRSARPVSERRVGTAGRRREAGGEGSDRRDKHAQQASERHRQRMREVKDLEHEGDRLLLQGKPAKARAIFTRAIGLCQDFDRKNSLLFKVEQARQGLSRRRRKRVLMALPLLLLLVGVAWWQGMPQLHRSLAEQQYVTLDTAVPVQLEAFIRRHQRWQEAYTVVFPSYPLPALERAEEALRLLRERERLVQRTVRVRTEVSELQGLIDDQTVSWQTVLDRARELLPEADPADHERLTAIRDQAQAEVDQRQEAVNQVVSQLAGGEIDQAVAAAEILRQDPRLSSEQRARLPRGVSLAVRDRHDRPLPQAKVLIDGVVSESGLAYRRGDRPVRLEVTLPGYIRHLSEIAPAGGDAASELAVVLDRGRTWQIQVDAHGDGRWSRLATDHEGRLWLHGPRSTNVIQVSDGTRLGQVQPPPAQGAAWMPWIGFGPDAVTVASTTGVIFDLQAQPSGIQARESLRLGQPVQAHLRFAASFRDGVAMQAAVVSTAEGSALLGVEGDQEDWRIDGLAVGEDPLLLHRRARLLVVGTQVIYAVEEEGRPTGTLTFPDARIGSACTLGNDHVLIPTHGAVHALRISERGDLLQLLAESVPLLAPPALGLVGDGEVAAVVTADGRVLLLRIVEGNPRQVWSVQLSARMGRPRALAISPDGVTVVGETAQIAVLDRKDGSLLQVVDHDVPVLAATVVGKALIAYGENARLVAYEFIR